MMLTRSGATNIPKKTEVMLRMINGQNQTKGAREALARAGVDPQRRGETLSVEEFAAVERAL